MVPLTLVERLEQFGKLSFLKWVPATHLARAGAFALLGIVVLIVSYAALGVPSDAKEASCSKAPARRRLPHVPDLSWSRRCIVICTAVMLLCWLPYLIASFPCAMSSDAYDQLYQYQSSAPTYYHFLKIYVAGEFVDHHPVVDTLIIGGFSDLGDALGSQSAGFFLLVLVQSCLTALFLSMSCCYLRRLGAPRALSVGMLAFCCLFPVFPRYCTAIAKDMIFCVGWIPFFLCYLEAFRTRGRALRRPAFLVALVAAGGWCIVTKKLGTYVVVPSLLVMVLALRGERLRALVSLVATVVLFSVLLPAVLYPAVGGVTPGGKQEALGFTIQQIVAVDLEDPNAMTLDERVAVERLWGLKDAEEDYKPWITDPVKKHFHWENANPKAIREYLAAWASIGMRNPVSYLKTIVHETYALYVPSSYMDWYETPNHSTDADYKCGAYFRYVRLSSSFHLDMHRPDQLIRLSRGLDRIWKALRNCPWLSLFATRGLYGGWIPFGCLMVTLYRRKRDVLALTPVALTMATFLVCPTALTRYMYMMLVILPLCLGWANRSRKGLAAA